MKLYREVKCSDRLPEEGIYHTIGTTNKDGTRVFESLEFVNGEFDDSYYEVDSWLEEFEINELKILRELNRFNIYEFIGEEESANLAQAIIDILNKKR